MAIGFDISDPQAALLGALLKEVPHWPPREFEPEDGGAWNASHLCAAMAFLFKRDLARTWVMVLSLEAVTLWLTAELGGNDVLHSVPRVRLAELRTELLRLKEEYAGAVGDLPSEPDPELMELLKDGIRKGDLVV